MSSDSTPRPEPPATAWVQTRVAGLPFPLLEPRRGYRAGPENLLLPGCLSPARDPSHVLDLGAGSGILGLLVGCAFPHAYPQVTLVEREPLHVECASQNAAAYPGDAVVLDADLRTATLPSAAIVVANPPYFRPDEGQPSKHASVRHATHAHFGGVAEFADAMARALCRTGTGWLVYPADRAGDAMLAISAAGLHVRQAHWGYARHRGASAGPYRVWLAAMHTPGPLEHRSMSCWTTR